MSILARLTGMAAVAMLMSAGSAAHVGPAAGHFGDSRIGLDWQQHDGHLTDVQVVDAANHRTIAVTAPFAIHLGDGTVLTPANLTMEGSPRLSSMVPDPTAARLAWRKPRTRLDATFTDAAGRLRVGWALIQVADAPYLRESVTITALKHDEKIPRVDLFSAEAPGAGVVGRVAGSPVVIAGHEYFQFENPLSQSETGVDHPTIRLWIDRALPLEKGKSVTYSAAVGTVRPGQLRRDFQLYVEDQRAHPYRPFLHYNSWYDIGYFTPYTAAQAIDRIDTFCRELSDKRGVKLDSFLFDDGWDDRSGSWNFSKFFPDGFVPLKTAAAKCGAAPGIWLSPWGGYDQPKAERIANAAGKYETIDGGFALSGPNYYKRFHDVTMDLITRQGINQFKFDGTGNADSVVPGSQFNSDFDAAISLIEDLRAAKPDLFVNLTTGTYPSPAWLRTADTIWRGGEDHDFAGVGPSRERWITYRDQQVYENIVVGGPLFPINSLMLHGILYAQHAVGLNSDPGDDFANEVHSYFASGTELQEMYITPSLLTSQNWDTLAAAARWSRANAPVLKDSHWLGGDPGRLQVYGWGAWSPAKSIVTLRNPDDKPQSFLLELGRALELPEGAPDSYAASALWPAHASAPTTLMAGKPQVIELAPFEVLTLELTPHPDG